MSRVQFNGYNYKFNIFKPLLGLTRLGHQRQSDMGERLEVNVQLKRLKDTKTTGDIVWKHGETQPSVLAFLRQPRE